MKMDRKNKCLLHGYGSYGLPLDIGFNLVYLSALENDWILAFAHVRGGSEKGWKWHQQAKGANKMVSFEDFINCAEFLVAQGYTHPSFMCAYGSSAGGLLVATVINMRPNLFKAVILNVPFLDVLTALTNENLPLTKSDHEEFGNPITDKNIYELISSYSPYENIQPQEYPFVYISCGTKDFRAPFWMVMKYLKRFRDRVSDNRSMNSIVPKNILVNATESGHYGTKAGIEEFCFNMALLDQIIFQFSKDIKIK